MRKHLKAAAFCIALAIPFVVSTVLAAEKPKPAHAAPIPTQILTAKKAFIANAGGDERPLEDEPRFSGDADRAYNEFYADIKTWGRFELVATPAEADLILEIRFTDEKFQQVGNLGSGLLDPQFRLLIRDAKTNAVLWGITQHVQNAILLGNRDKNFSQALTAVVAEVKRIAIPSGAPPGPAKKQ